MKLRETIKNFDSNHKLIKEENKYIERVTDGTFIKICQNKQLLNHLANLSSGEKSIIFMILQNINVVESGDEIKINRILITKPVKEEWGEIVNIKPKSINKILVNLQSNSILKMSSQHTYYLNPGFFFMGSGLLRYSAIEQYKKLTPTLLTIHC